jgi:hypothetical protein
VTHLTLGCQFERLVGCLLLPIPAGEKSTIREPIAAGAGDVGDGEAVLSQPVNAMKQPNESDCFVAGRSNGTGDHCCERITTLCFSKS